jgi:uncharacterized protein YecE (DUF72 family)
MQGAAAGEPGKHGPAGCRAARSRAAGARSLPPPPRMPKRKGKAARIRVGPAGWHYDDWAGVVYPDPNPRGFDPLRYLAGYFDTVELNNTFYRPPVEKTARSWIRRVEDRADFRFTAKLYRRFTHQRKEAWTQAEVDEVRAGMAPMLEAGRLGALLLQFPWSFRRTDENREWLEDLAEAFGEFPRVVEVRHASWNVPEFYAELGARGIGFVNVDQPLYRDSIAPSARSTAAAGYVRVHGRNYHDWFREAAGRDERYDYLYTPDELEPWAARTREIAEEPETEDVFVVTNNHYRGKAVANALMLRSMAEHRVVAGPPPLFDAYPEVLEGYAEPRAPDGSAEG